MPRRRRSVEETAQSEFDREFEAVLERLAAEQGPAPGVRAVSRPREVRDWGTEDRSVDPAALAQRLMAGGLAPEEATALEVVKDNADNEELLAAYTQPTEDYLLADTLARLARYPYRLAILATIDDPEERVAKAESLDRAWQASLPSAPPAPPTGPSLSPSAPTDGAVPAGEGASDVGD